MNFDFASLTEWQIGSAPGLGDIIPREAKGTGKSIHYRWSIVTGWRSSQSNDAFAFDSQTQLDRKQIAWGD